MDLDVGCGVYNRAEIRIDVLKTRRNTHNVLASAHYLPFRNQVFERVLCFHVLEHLKKPKQALKELRRVGKTVKIKIPFLFYHHKHRFDVSLLQSSLSFSLDLERTQFKIPFRIECSTTIRARDWM